RAALRTNGGADRGELAGFVSAAGTPDGAVLLADDGFAHFDEFEGAELAVRAAGLGEGAGIATAFEARQQAGPDAGGFEGADAACPWDHGDRLRSRQVRPQRA